MNPVENSQRRRVLGVDGCTAGWVGVLLDDTGRFAGSLVAGTIGDLVTHAATGEPPAVVGIDMPIGLPDRGERAADQQARTLLGRRRSALFMTPTRAALYDHDTLRAANEAHRVAGEKGISAQAWALRGKIQQVDRWLASAPGYPVIEVHPELSFAEMAGSPLAYGKKTWGGAAQRRQLLREQGIDIPTDTGPAARIGADDVADAAAVAWTAWRRLRGAAIPVPAQPETFSDGLAAQIWR